MTFREKLTMEHPNSIRDTEWGGCFGCPGMYGYEEKHYCCEGGDEECTRCWDREIPETAKKKTHAIPSGIIRIPDEHAEPIHITIHTTEVDDSDAVIAEVFKYVYTIKDRVVNISIQ